MAKKAKKNEPKGSENFLLYSKTFMLSSRGIVLGSFFICRILTPKSWLVNSDGDKWRSKLKTVLSKRCSDITFDLRMSKSLRLSLSITITVASFISKRMLTPLYSPESTCVAPAAITRWFPDSSRSKSIKSLTSLSLTSPKTTVVLFMRLTVLGSISIVGFFEMLCLSWSRVFEVPKGKR